jgi:hypothetical protein
MELFVRVGTGAAVAGGALLAAGAALQAGTAGDGPFSAQVVTPSFATATALRLTGAVLLVWGIVALYLRVAGRAGRFGLVAVVACVANLVLQAGWMFTDLFVAPVLADVAPQILDGETPTRLGTAFMLAWLANTSFVLLGAAVLRTRSLPLPVGLGLIVAGAVTLVPLPVDGPIYEIMIGIALALAGAAALRVSTQARGTATLLAR